ncbi:baseplate J/gp47 family protein [Kocuria rhizosphaericola]|uniref:baseplate J/gp47 family protein n=1 Tax=Kocuria rhizosphaericola TaxID=3376284 RepID=UPI0037AC2D76
MSIPVPHLDDRDFADLVGAARERIRQVDPTWDPSVHDPAMVIIEAFAHLTDMLLYRLNRVPEKVYAVLLNLMGTSVHPPAAARTELEFTRAGGKGSEIVIPRGTQVGPPPGVPGVPQPLFSTTADAVLAANETGVRVGAVDAALHEAVLLGVGSGRPGQVFQLPVVPAVSGPGLRIGIEVPPEAVPRTADAVLAEGSAFLFCREVEAFADADPREAVVRVDRSSGLCVFAWWNETDDAPPAVPGPGAQVRAWYRSGGGARGNVAADCLTVMRTPVAGLRCSNPEPATGGRDAEPLEEALRRAPQDFHARDRAVTARDYEKLASRHGGVARARAYTRRDLWSFAGLGEVEVVLVPQVPEAQRPGGAVPAGTLAAQARDDVRRDVDGYLRARATIGASPVVHWSSYKQVLVDARVVVRPEEDPAGVRTRILDRLYRTITPLPPDGPGHGSSFGHPLRVSNLYRVLEEGEPGILYVDRVRLHVDQVPDADASALVRAPEQAGTWFVARSSTLFRTVNGGDGWEPCADFSGETVRAVSPFPASAPGRGVAGRHPGKVAVATETDGGARIYLSDDLGGGWCRAADLGFVVTDLSWVDRSGQAVVLMAGERGLYELADAPGAVPVQNLVDPSTPDRGFHTVDAFTDVRGRTGVVVTAVASAGLWLSPESGAPESFQRIRAAGDDVRCLSVQYDGPATYLWIGRVVPEGNGMGCARLRLGELDRTRFDAELLAAWEDFTQGWSGGSCLDVVAIGSTVYAATHSAGVIQMPLDAGRSATWDHRDVNCGLPLRDRTRFAPVRSVSGDASGPPLLLAAGPHGVLRSTDAARTWEVCSRRVVDDVVTLPGTWLFCSGEHRVEVVSSRD